ARDRGGREILKRDRRRSGRHAGFRGPGAHWPFSGTPAHEVIDGPGPGILGKGAPLKCPGREPLHLTHLAGNREGGRIAGRAVAGISPEIAVGIPEVLVGQTVAIVVAPVAELGDTGVNQWVAVIAVAHALRISVTILVDCVIQGVATSGTERPCAVPYDHEGTCPDGRVPIAG